MRFLALPTGEVSGLFPQRLSFGRGVPVGCTIGYSIDVVRMAVGRFNVYPLKRRPKTNLVYFRSTASATLDFSRLTVKLPQSCC
jgi:hypothetical protein